MDVKASSTGAVVVPGCGMSLRRQQVRRSPETADGEVSDSVTAVRPGSGRWNRGK